MHETQPAKCCDGPSPQASCGPHRASAAAVFRERAEHLRRQAHRMESLAIVAAGLPPGSEAEEALWQVAIESR